MAFTLLPEEVTPQAGSKFTLLPDDNEMKAEVSRMVMAPASPFGRLAPDVVMGARQVADAIAQMPGQIGVALTSPDSALGKAARAGAAIQGAPVEQAWSDYKRDWQPQNQTGAGFARGLGQAAVTAPLLPAGGGVMAAAGTGGLSGLLTPVYGAKDGEFWGEKGKQAALGAATGGAFGAGAKIVGKALRPLSGDAELLASEGVSLTPGQALGGAAKTVEDKLTSLPLVGDAIMASRARGLEDFNRALYARALAPFGKEGAEVAAKAPAGRDGIAAVGDFLSGKYQAALSQTKVGVDQPFVQAMGQLAQMAKQLPQQQQEQFVAILKQQMAARGLVPGQVISGETMKVMDSELGKLAFMYRNGNNSTDLQLLGDALRQAQQNLRDMVARQNPAVAPIVQAADKGWSMLAQIERAGSMLGARDGIISPAQLSNAVKRGDNSVRDRMYARGEMANQDLATAGQKVLPSSVPDSGTTGRAVVAAGVGALGGGAAHSLGLMSPELLATGAALSLPYLPGIGPALMALLTKRPEVMRSLGDVVSGAAPALGLAAGSSLLPTQ